MFLVPNFRLWIAYLQALFVGEWSDTRRDFPALKDVATKVSGLDSADMLCKTFDGYPTFSTLDFPDPG